MLSVVIPTRNDERALVRSSVLSAVIGSVNYPFVADLDDDVVRHELLAVARQLLAPAPAASAAPVS